MLLVGLGVSEMVVLRALAAAIMLLAGFAAPAAAGDLDEVHSFDLVVSGAVREQCALGSIADFDFGNLERPGLGIEAKVPFYCNVPFTMTINGERGALTHTSMPQGQGPYAGKVPYSFGIVMPIRRPTQGTVSQRFASHKLRSGGTIASQGGIATDGMVIAIELAPSPGEAGLLAGNYVETITITVAPL